MATRNFRSVDWRVQNLYPIVTKQSQRVFMKRNQIQEQFAMQRGKRNMILKARQFGISTHELISMLDFVLWNDNVTACVLAHERDSITKLFEIIRRAYKYMPKKIKPVLDKGGGSRYEYRFPQSNSKIYCDLESRGDTINWLHASEVAFMKDKDKLDATLQTVPQDGFVTLETTVNGMDNFFYDMWNDENSTYKKHFFPWYFFPEYQIQTSELAITHDERALIEKARKLFGLQITKEQIAYRRFKISELKEKFIQEYPEDDQTCFLTSGKAVMDGIILKKLQNLLTPPVLSEADTEIYIPYKKDHLYVCGADTSEGVNSDFSVATIFDATTYEQVAQCRGQFKPSDFAHKINELCKNYHTGGRFMPTLAVERNNHGHAVLLELKEHIHYPRLYHAKDGRPGWVTDRVTRPIMINAWVDGIENQTMKINSRDTLNECLTLINNKGKIEAAKGKHDDCIMAGALAVQMVIESKKLSVYDNIDSKILVI